MTTAAPSGCRHCGISKPEHMQRWKSGVGWHAWEPPTQAQILARMKARRAQPTDPHSIPTV
ncbi:hypothetical protein [Kitasatospora sp. NPDC057223]|uniref:hypothetical protein n=1 Tax=Kitasatospora sp. NPDC057223 TaxID=3346055 RepID=UPI0036334D67